MTSSNSSEEISNAENLENDLLEEITYDILKAISKSQEEGQDEHEKKEVIINIEKTKELDIKEDSVVDANKKMLIPLENNPSTFSLEICKQDKASGPGFIFSKDYKTIYNFHEKCPPVPYCEGFDARFSPELKLFVYPTLYFIHSYEETAEEEEEEIPRSHFLKEILVLLIIQYVMTFSFCFALSYLLHTYNWKKVTFVTLSLSIVIFVAILCSDPLRKTKPWNYVTLSIFTLCTACNISPFVYGLTAVGSLYYFILSLLFYIPCAFCCCIDFTRYFCLIDALFSMTIILFVIAIILELMGIINKDFVIIILFLTVLVMPLSIIHQFQLLRGKGEYAMQTDEYILSPLLLYIHINIIFFTIPALCFFIALYKKL